MIYVKILLLVSHNILSPRFLPFSCSSVKVASSPRNQKLARNVNYLRVYCWLVASHYFSSWYNIASFFELANYLTGSKCCIPMHATLNQPNQKTPIFTLLDTEMLKNIFTAYDIRPTA